MSSAYDITVKKGTTFQLPIIYQDSNGAPLNLTGYTAKLQIRPYEGGPLVAEFNTTNGQVAINGLTGTVTLSLSQAATAALPTGQYQYDLYVYFGASAYCVVYGNFIIQQEITV